MTGEMHKSEVTRESFPIHFAIADALVGEVRPFDQYQGPYVLVGTARLWLCPMDDGFSFVYNEANEKESGAFPMYNPETSEFAVAMARSVLAGE